MKIAVLDIGGTFIKAGIFEKGKICDKTETQTQAFKGGAFVLKRAEEILEGYGKVDRIGISTAGQVDAVQGVIRYANDNIPSYTGMKIKDRMEALFNIPTAVENDVNAAALGEAHFGAGRDFSDFLCLTYGTGVGGAIVIDGDVYRGSTFSAGEMGAIVLHPEDRRPKEDMFSGCYEKYASVSALVSQVKQLDASLDSGRKILAALERQEIKAAVDGWVLEIALGLSSLIHIFNPSCVILGGGIMRAEYITGRVKEFTQENIMQSYRDVKIIPAGLGNEAGMFGAAHCAMRL